MGGAACLKQGDTLMILPGNYNEWIENPLPNNATMRGADPNPTNWPSVRPSNNVVPGGRAAIAIPQSRTNISFRFIRIDLSQITSGNKPANCFNTQNSATSFTLEDFECIGPAPGMMFDTGSGIGVSSAVGSLGIVRRGVIRDLTAESANPGTHGFYWRGPNGLVEHVYIENINGRCVSYRYSAANNTFRNNFCKNGKAPLSVSGSQGDTSNNRLYNNVFWNVSRVELEGHEQKFYNNTVYQNWSPPQECMRLRSGGSNHVVRNNIFLNCGSSTINDQSTGSIISHNITSGNPEDFFTDYQNGDFSLKAGSAAIDAGTTISDVTRDFVGTSRPQGCCYDIGAFEYPSSISTPPLSPSNLTLQ